MHSYQDCLYNFPWYYKESMVASFPWHCLCVEVYGTVIAFTVCTFIQITIHDSMGQIEIIQLIPFRKLWKQELGWCG